MNIKKVDDKPMEIHTKEKPKFHVKEATETKIKDRNTLTVQHGPKIAGNVAAGTALDEMEGGNEVHDACLTAFISGLTSRDK